MRPLFITFEGGEGSGKTTQISLLKRYLEDQGNIVLLTREPGGCASAEAIRTLLLTGAADKWSPLAETLLFQAARIEHTERVIKPALAQGAIVLCDRYLDSTIVYQGISKKLGAGFIQQLHTITLENFQPCITLLLDIPPAIGLQRASERHGLETRFENMGVAFHEQVRKGFLTLARQSPERYRIIDATAAVEEVHNKIIESICHLLQ